MIAHEPEMPGRLLVFHFQVADRAAGAWAPVDEPLTLVDQALVVEGVEGVAHGARALLIEGEGLALPIAGGAQTAMLLADEGAITAAPGPSQLHELLAAEVVAAERLLVRWQREVDIAQQVIHER